MFRKRKDRKRGKTEATEEVDGWALAREILAEVPVFASRTDFNVFDPEFVDPIIQDELDRNRRFGGVMPTTRREVQRLCERLKGRYRNAHFKTPEGRARLEEAIREFYDDPLWFSDDEVVTVDLGYAPGTLERTGRVGWGIAKSEVEDRGELLSTEVGRFLERFAREHPDATYVDLQVVVPTGYTGKRTLRYRHARGEDRVWVFKRERPTDAWMSVPLGGDPGRLTRGEISVHTEDCRLVRLSDRIEWNIRVPD